MAWQDITADTLIAATAVYDRGGLQRWQDLFGFQPAKNYAAIFDIDAPVGGRYDTRVLISIAHLIQFPTDPVLKPLAFADLQRPKLDRWLTDTYPTASLVDL